MLSSISTVILKPTKFCSAQCTYCSAPPEVNGAPKWSLDQFKFYFDKLNDYLTNQAVILWHGGEPMLMGPDFYWNAWEYAKTLKSGIKFSMQSNILGYESKRWKDLLSGPFSYSISTSFDPDERNRLIKGSPTLYTKIFFSRLDKMIEDGFRPLVIGTYTDETIDYVYHMYEKSLSYGDKCFDIRLNYRYPVGRATDEGCLLSPKNYGEMLIKLYNRWIKELPSFNITPLDQMFKKVALSETNRCPWSNSCGGRFLGIEPNGDVYNCSEFADVNDTSYSFGNINNDLLKDMLHSKPALDIKRRRVNLPSDCLVCPHFNQCEGGCARDSVLFGNGIGGKFFYCLSWKMVFSRIKESIRTGEADGLFLKLNINPEIKNYLISSGGV